MHFGMDSGKREHKSCRDVGGATLQKPLEEITLFDVYRAITSNNFLMHTPLQISASYEVKKIINVT